MAKFTDWDAPLQMLWQRRDDLHEQDWERLYQLTFHILRAYPFKEHQGLTLPLDDCITDFFVQKVYEPTVREGYAATTPVHANALREYFRRFLIDLQRAQVDHAPLDDEHTAQQIATRSWRAFLEAEPDTGDLEESFVSERYQTAARTFLEQQEPWVGLYLRYHLCAHYAGEDPAPLVRFKDSTLLGRWLRSLDLTPAADDDRDRIRLALKILCQQSLLWVKDVLPCADAADSATDPKE